MGLELTDSVIAFVDILGFRKLVENKEDLQQLFSVIENIKNQNTEKCHIEHSVEREGFAMKITPAVSSFSDCIAFSIPMKDVMAPFWIVNVVNGLLDIIRQLADSLMFGGYILRGGITRGELHHQNGVIFGQALIDAYELESKKAVFPRILVSNKLAEEYNKKIYSQNDFLMQDNESDDYSLDYLKLSFQDHDTRERYMDTAEKMVVRFKNSDPEILKKWLYFHKYVRKTAKLYE